MGSQSVNKRPKIWHVNKRDFFEHSFHVIDQ